MRVGLIVNPYAGLGGPFALKGTDGDLAEQALAGGGTPVAAPRAARALSAVADIAGVELVTVAGAMGEAAASAAGLNPKLVHRAPARPTARDTANAARALCGAGVDLLLFAGGDGTARALLGTTGDVPVLGVPAGVRMHSGVFATSPAAAGATLRELVRTRALARQKGAVLEGNRAGQPILHGHLPVPASARRQAAKQTGSVGADPDLAACCIQTAHELVNCPLAVIGTGATMLAVKQALAGDGTLLGVDVFSHGRMIARDADEATLWRLVCAADPAAVRLLLGVVGGQGFLLGRGNQQLSPRVVASIHRDNITVLAAAEKLAALEGGRLLVDSGDEALDHRLAGQIGVRIGPRRRMVMVLDAG